MWTGMRTRGLVNPAAQDIVSTLPMIPVLSFALPARESPLQLELVQGGASIQGRRILSMGGLDPNYGGLNITRMAIPD